ncbi:MAG: MotA/TolQ/ExbB proton channel family protein [Prevotella sp.]|nr:MotA/TolQ/ExbB proton channel family protein [Prevotella sp.]MCI6511200.1 MotA/TolQ/ExbB proton channel family protein [Prevotella sp.]MDD7129810.1 MotA/TolQ/ExbB proton channel family protein [Prevotella sp.]MDY4539344.1 MotA/TolQ/ExbB proton channel family protein [Prevotella sp.]MDY4843204.1 MotA/TolQ/ExbB proton channel family protein [Prevotella sp.]
MAATQKPAQKKQSTGFQGVRNAVWIIAAMFIVAVCIFKFVLGNPANFVGGDPEGEVLNGNMLGTIYKGGIVVPVLITLMLTVLCLSVERYLAQRTAFGKMATTKFVVAIKAALAKNDFVEAKNLCAKQRGTIANVVGASLNAYEEMERTQGIKKAQKISKIQQAHEEAVQLEMPTLQMNMPILATLVTLGTLTALFGTVTGMIKSFAALASGGGGDSVALSTGISEALINTALGILTSWLAVVSYNFFSNRIDKLTYALDEVGYTIAQTYEANHDEA